MGQEIAIEAQPRERLRKGGARQLRRDGRIPITLYGGENKPAVSLSVNAREFEKIFRSESGLNTIFDLRYDSESTPVILKDWQVHPVKGSLLHADLIRINMMKLTRVRVPVELDGEPVGVKTQGGMLDFATHLVEVECLPGDIPDRIHINIAELTVGEHVSVKDLRLGDKVRILEDPDRVIISIFAPRVEGTPTPTLEEGAATEPGAEGESEDQSDKS